MKFNFFGDYCIWFTAFWPICVTMIPKKIAFSWYSPLKIWISAKKRINLILTLTIYNRKVIKRKTLYLPHSHYPLPKDLFVLMQNVKALLVVFQFEPCNRSWLKWITLQWLTLWKLVMFFSLTKVINRRKHVINSDYKKNVMCWTVLLANWKKMCTSNVRQCNSCLSLFLLIMFHKGFANTLLKKIVHLNDPPHFKSDFEVWAARKK